MRSDSIRTISAGVAAGIGREGGIKAIWALMSKKRDFFVIFLFSMSTLVVLAFSVYVVDMMGSTNDFAVETVQNHLKVVAQGLSRAAGSGELNQIQGPDDVEKPIYDALKYRIAAYAARTRVRWAYYIRKTDDGGMRYIIGNGPDSAGKVDVAAPPVPMMEAARLAFEGNLAASELGDYAAGARNLISGFAPVRNEYGLITAIAGLDIDDGKLIMMQRQEKIVSIMLLISIFIVIPTGLLSLFMYRRKAAQAEAHNATKSDFLSRMSHEMRTPLNAIIGLSELAIGDAGIRDEARDNMRKVHQAGVTLLSIINDILDIAKVESGKFELLPAEYDTPSLINDVVTMNSMRIGDKPIEFVLNVDKLLPHKLYGDELRIKQIFNNLLSNAFKYTRKGRVEWRIGGEKADDAGGVWLTSSVSDTGIGIRQDNLKDVFTDYYQFDRKANRRIEGTGLGLSIAKMLAEMMGGTISVESRYGQGSVFTVRLLQKRATATHIGDAVAKNLMKFHYSEDKSAKKAIMSHIYIPYARVLVVDDVVTNLDVARGLMKPYGMTVDCVTGGQDAVDAVRQAKVKYDAIFMDHMMPGMDGMEAAAAIRGLDGEYARKVPIIALTANAITGNTDVFLSKGFQAFISKPIDVLRLDAAIRRWVRDPRRDEEMRAAAPPPAPAPAGDMARLALETLQVDGIDFAKGLERFSGDAGAYLKVLESYAASTPSLLDRARGLARDDVREYAVAVHGIKGSSYGIGAERIGRMAEELERAAKAGDSAFIGENHDRFAESAGELLGNLSAMLKKARPPSRGPKASSPDPEALRSLRKACAAYDMDGVNEAMLELEGVEYDSGTELLAWIRERVDAMDFKQIEEKLAEDGGDRG